MRAPGDKDKGKVVWERLTEQKRHKGQMDDCAGDEARFMSSDVMTFFL
jgi:hypothetical protein